MAWKDLKVKHASNHSDGGIDEITVENLATASSDTSQVLKPDGSGGLAMGAATPAAHAASHTDGTDDIRDATNALKGLATAAQITTLESALQNVVEDTTPQLGGTLDMNGNDIESATTGGAYIQAAAGSATDPVFGFKDDETTGVGYKSAGSAVCLVSAGTQVMEIDTAQVDILGVDLDLNGNNLVGVTNVDGRDVSADGANVDLNTTHRTSDGSDHSFIDQDVTSGSSPTFDGANITGLVTGDVDQIHIASRKGSVGTISQGRPVYVSGWNASGWLEVEEADNSDTNKLPAIGLAESDLTNAATDWVVLGGKFTNLDTSAYSVGDELYVAAAAALTTTKPTGTAKIQKVAQVVRSHASQGVLTVFGAGRVNDVPNIPDGQMWIGNASAVATAVTMSGDATISNAGVLTIASGAVEGTEIASTGEAGGTKYLREDGDGTCSWQTVSAGGMVQGSDGTYDLQPANEGATAGNARGENSFDGQTLRSAATMVASGARSTIGGGEDNTASGTESTVGGGEDNTASGIAATVGGGQLCSATANYTTVGGGTGNSASDISATVSGGSSNTATQDYSAVGGGFSNAASGQYSTIAGGDDNAAASTAATVGGGADNAANSGWSTVSGGRNNTASADYGTVGGGYLNTAGAQYSIAPGGYYSNTALYGQHAHAAGRFAATGDAQYIRFVMRNQTTDATVTSLFLDGSSARASVPTDTTWQCKIKVTARQTGGVAGTDGDSWAYEIDCLIENTAGVTQVKLNNQTVLYEDDANFDAVVDATSSATNDALDIDVTGAASKNVNWVAVVEGVQITG